jgi:hypothetical protein
MKRLAERLKKSIEIGSAGGPLRSLMDPATLTVLMEAMEESVVSKSVHKIEELLERAAKIAEVLSSDNPKKNIIELEQTRDFCVALSKATRAYRNSIRELRPHHPFRK